MRSKKKKKEQLRDVVLCTKKKKKYLFKSVIFYVHIGVCLCRLNGFLHKTWYERCACP